MRRIKLFAAIILFVLTSSCMTSRLGFPVKSFETPITVTLFSNIIQKGLLTKKADLYTRESWKVLYDQRYLDMLSKVNRGRLRNRLDELFLKKALATSDLFKIQRNEIFNGGLDYSKNADDLENYSGYDFSNYAGSIPTKYILAFTVDEWGYVVTKEKQTTGPYMLFTIQLIDRDTSLSLWSFSNLYQKEIEIPLGATEPGDIVLADIEDTMMKIIPKAVDDFFRWLNQK